jgi:hypothetical protein
MSPSPYYCCWVSWEKRRDFTTTISSQFLHLFFSPFFYIFRLLIHRFQKLSEWIKFFFHLFSRLYIFFIEIIICWLLFFVLLKTPTTSQRWSKMKRCTSRPHSHSPQPNVFFLFTLFYVGYVHYFFIMKT